MTRRLLLPVPQTGKKDSRQRSLESLLVSTAKELNLKPACRYSEISLEEAGASSVTPTKKTSIIFCGENGEDLEVSYTNRASAVEIDIEDLSAYGSVLEARYIDKLKSIVCA